MEKNIAVIWGDCSSPEIVKQTIRVLDKVAEKYGHTFHYTDAAMGGEATDKYGDPLPQHELDKCLAADSVLLGAVGGPKWEGLPGEQRPEKGLLRLRAGMGLYSNNRPAKIWPQLAPASPLKPEIVAQGIDFIIVRELIGGVYFGNHETHTLASGEKQAIDSMPYAEHEIERIGRIGFHIVLRLSEETPDLIHDTAVSGFLLLSRALRYSGFLFSAILFVSRLLLGIRLLGSFYILFRSIRLTILHRCSGNSIFLRIVGGPSVSVCRFRLISRSVVFSVLFGLVRITG